MLTDQGLPVVIGSCTMCGWDDTYTTGGLCMDCASIREWSRGNRAFCQLIHGEWPGRVVEDIRAPERIGVTDVKEVVDVAKKAKKPMPVKKGY